MGIFECLVKVKYILVLLYNIVGLFECSTNYLFYFISCHLWFHIKAWKKGILLEKWRYTGIFLILLLWFKSLKQKKKSVMFKIRVRKSFKELRNPKDSRELACSQKLARVPFTKHIKKTFLSLVFINSWDFPNRVFHMQTKIYLTTLTNMPYNNITKSHANRNIALF